MNKIKPLISVIVTAFNEEVYIGRCLRSLLNQNLASDFYEIIVVDDCSSDLTSYALKMFGSSINVIRNRKNIGLPASINKGIKASKGEYIVRVDADDYVNSSFLSILKTFLNQNDHYDAIACDYLLVDDSEKVITRINCMQQPIACGIMFKKKHLVEIGLYDENFLRHEERDLRIRYEKKYVIGHVELPLYRYRRHMNNITNDVDKMEEHLHKLKKKHKLK